MFAACQGDEASENRVADLFADCSLANRTPGDILGVPIDATAVHGIDRGTTGLDSVAGGTRRRDLRMIGRRRSLLIRTLRC